MILDLQALRAAWPTQRFELRFFYGHRARPDGRLSDAVFSQFYPCDFTLDGQRYRWAEQWMMAGKARLFGDEAALKAILAAGSPAACKQLGRQVRGFDEDTWRAARFEIVTRGNLEKFDQDPRLRDYLLGTGEAILVEASPGDRVWGIGLSASHPDARDPSRWRGLNLLGFALTRARAVLRGELPPPA